MSYDEAVAWLYGTQLHGIKLGLDNIQRLVGALRISLRGAEAPTFLHVAGTNGKGSTCAMLDAMCRSGSLSTGLFTSPHLVTFRERLRCNGEMIAEKEVIDGLTSIRSIIADWEHSPTFFEITTALALLWFQKRRCRVVILETGMGGRLDATNVVTPVVSVITPIALDHQQWLGSTLPEIAAEKAGIIKPRVPVVCAPQQDEAMCVLAHIAFEREAAFHPVRTPLNAPAVNLPGEHQRWNAAVATRAMNVAGLHIIPERIERALREVRWPGRFQRIGARIVLDGAHNTAAMQQLARTWTELFAGEKASVIIGILKDKDLRGICTELLPIAARILAVPVQSVRTRNASEILSMFGELDAMLPCEVCPNVAAAVERASRHSEKMLITGSLFLVGEAIAHLEGRPLFETSAQ